MEVPLWKWEVLFIFLFCFRYLRLIVHTISFWLLYRPSPIPKTPRYHSWDVTVVIPTVDPENPSFVNCLRSIIVNAPNKIIIVVPNKEMLESTKAVLTSSKLQSHEMPIIILQADKANKLKQVACAIPHIATDITVISDDHVFWRSPNFLPTILAHFENENIDAVGTNKRAIRNKKGFRAAAFWNMLGAVYLERQNFDVRATNALDGGVFVLSGRTSAHRTSISKSEEFLTGYLNERFFFGIFGPLNCDDDNFITRYEVRQGWDIKIQHCADGLMETPLGEYPKFISQCLCWVRTTWRSNSASIFTDRTVWYRQPWCVYAVYLTSFVNLALFYDLALVTTFCNTVWNSRWSVYWLIGWIIASKLVKLVPYFLRQPQDIIFFPGHVAFGYFHSLIKLYALLTFWDYNVVRAGA